MLGLSDPLRAARRAVQDGRYQDAVAALDRVDATTREGPEAMLLASMADWRLGEFAESRRKALSARSGFRAVGDADGEMRSENVAAAGAFGLGDLEEAELGFSRALELAKQIGDQLMVARCANNLGNVSLYLAHHELALAYYSRARIGFEHLAFLHGVAETWINTAIVWRDLERMGEALAAADAGLDAAERSQTNRLVGEALSTRAEAAAALGDVPLARAQVTRGLALAREEIDRLAEADALRILANIERRARNHADAERLGREALDVAIGTKHPWALAEVRRDLGELFVDLGRDAEAAQAFSDAGKEFLKLGSVSRATAMQTRAKATRAG